MPLLIRHRLLLLLLLLFVAASHGDPAGDNYNTSMCLLPSYTCGNVTIRYPFYLANETGVINRYNNSYCGYPGLGILCEDDKPILQLNGPDKYTVTGINYGSGANVSLADSEVLDSSSSCPRADHDVTLPQNSWFSFPDGTVDYLVFFLGCNFTPYLFRPPIEEITCENFYRGPGLSFVLPKRDVPSGNWPQACDRVIEVPVLKYDDPIDPNGSAWRSGEFGKFLRRGFELAWNKSKTAGPCNRCERSNGRCSHNQTGQFMGCWCPNGRVDDRDCSAEKEDDMRKLQNEAKDKALIIQEISRIGYPRNFSYRLRSRRTEIELELGRLETRDLEKTAMFNEAVRIANENAKDIKSWEKRHAETIASHDEEIKKLDSRLVGYFNKRRKTYIIASTLSTFLLCLLLFAFFLGHKKYRSKKISKETPRIESFLQKNGTLHPKRYTYAEVKRMTNSFAVKLGQGGFGAVYRGNLSDGRQVAAKMLKDSKGDGEEFINEVASISRTSHVNVVTLLGFCLQGSKRVLIYEYMPNGSLERYAFNDNSKGGISLTWEKLFDIAVGIARGLEYLHRGCNTRIVHFDIKPHNILLDQDFCPKISDFGMAKLCINKESIISIGGARGTIGYIAPEVYSKQFGAVSSKSDVYSYGMMVLEMVGARDKNINANSESSSQYFPQWIYEHLDEYCVSASEINGEITEIVRKMIVIGLWCIQLNPTNRPTMTRVVEMLEGSTSGLELPPKMLLS